MLQILPKGNGRWTPGFPEVMKRSGDECFNTLHAGNAILSHLFSIRSLSRSVPHIEPARPRDNVMRFMLGSEPLLLACLIGGGESTGTATPCGRVNVVPVWMSLYEGGSTRARVTFEGCTPLLRWSFCWSSTLAIIGRRPLLYCRT